MEGCTVIEGHARFEDGNTLRVGDARMSAPQVFLNVGGRAAVPEMPGLDAIEWLTNTSILDLERVPDHPMIAGGGSPGRDCAQLHARVDAHATAALKGPRHNTP